MLASDPPDRRGELGQATLLAIGVVAAVLVGVMVLTSFGQALGAKGRHTRAVDLASMSAARSMRDDLPRLFEPAVLPGGVPNPRHLSTAAYLARARAAAVTGARLNGVRITAADVTFPGGSFAPTRVAVRVRGHADVLVPGGARERIAVHSRAVAELAPGPGGALAGPARGSGGGYDGPLAYRMGKAMHSLHSPLYKRADG